MARLPDDYVKVNDRIYAFREKFKEGVIVTERSDIDDDTVAFKARVFRTIKEAETLGPLNLAAATGHAEITISGEKDVEKCETVSIGRALAILGYKVEGSIASAEEMESFNEVKETKSKRFSKKEKVVEEEPAQEVAEESEETEESEQPSEEAPANESRLSRRKRRFR